MDKLLGIDLGGTGIKASLIRADGETIARVNRPTCDGEYADGMPAWAVSIKDIVSEIETEHGVVDTIGISCPGLVARDELSIACMPERLDGLVGLNWTDYLEKETPVYVINDAHSALLAEVHFGAARGMKNVYMIVIGTGVGGAIYADGKIMKGHIGRAGHLGHICLDIDGKAGITGVPGSIEDMIGNHNIAERSEGEFSTTHEMIAAMADGSPSAAKVWLRSVRALGCTIASLNNILDPEAVIIGGGIGKAGEALLQPLRNELDQIEWRPLGKGVPLVPAKLDEWAGSIGSAVHSRIKNQNE